MVKIKLLDANCVPFKKHDKDSGLDLRVRNRTRVWPGRTYRIPSGIAVGIPVGYVGDIRPRSSTVERQLLIQGTIDPGYTGEVFMLVTNLSDDNFFLDAGERIAQLVVMKTDTDVEYVDSLEPSERGDGGFGHTGRM